MGEQEDKIREAIRKGDEMIRKSQETIRKVDERFKGDDK